MTYFTPWMKDFPEDHPLSSPDPLAIFLAWDSDDSIDEYYWDDYERQLRKMYGAPHANTPNKTLSQSHSNNNQKYPSKNIHPKISKPKYPSKNTHPKISNQKYPSKNTHPKIPKPKYPSKNIHPKISNQKYPTQKYPTQKYPTQNIQPKISYPKYPNKITSTTAISTKVSGHYDASNHISLSFLLLILQQLIWIIAGGLSDPCFIQLIWRLCCKLPAWFTIIFFKIAIGTLIIIGRDSIGIFILIYHGTNSQDLFQYIMVLYLVYELIIKLLRVNKTYCSRSFKNIFSRRKNRKIISLFKQRVCACSINLILALVHTLSRVVVELFYYKNHCYNILSNLDEICSPSIQ